MAPGGQDLAFAGDDLGARADDDVDPGLRIGIARFSDPLDRSVLDCHVGFDDAPMIDDQRVGDHRVHSTLGTRALRLPHAIADHLAAAKFDLIPVDGEILLHFDDQLGVGESHPVADRRAVHRA